MYINISCILYILPHIQSTQEGLSQSKDNNDAFILAIGDGADNVKSMVIVCRNKVITDELGRCPYGWSFGSDCSSLCVSVAV